VARANFKLVFNKDHIQNIKSNAIRYIIVSWGKIKANWLLFTIRKKCIRWILILHLYVRWFTLLVLGVVGSIPTHGIWAEFFVSSHFFILPIHSWSFIRPEPKLPKSIQYSSNLYGLLLNILNSAERPYDPLVRSFYIHEQTALEIDVHSIKHLKIGFVDVQLGSLFTKLCNYIVLIFRF